MGGVTLRKKEKGKRKKLNQDKRQKSQDKSKKYVECRLQDCTTEGLQDQRLDREGVELTTHDARSTTHSIRRNGT